MDSFPNVHARLHLSRQAPALQKRDDDMEIWLRDTLFRVRDVAGRSLDMILEEIRAPRGLGFRAQTMEAIMDWNAAAGRRPRGATELGGDLATDSGWVRTPGSDLWTTSASQLAAVARQILADNRLEGLEEVRRGRRLGRPAVHYKGVRAIEEDGEVYHSDVTCIVSPPYLLYEHVSDASDEQHFYTRRVAALEEGVVGDEDVAQPGA